MGNAAFVEWEVLQALVFPFHFRKILVLWDPPKSLQASCTNFSGAEGGFDFWSFGEWKIPRYFQDPSPEICCDGIHGLDRLDRIHVRTVMFRMDGIFNNYCLQFPWIDHMIQDTRLDINEGPALSWSRQQLALPSFLYYFKFYRGISNEQG